MMWVLFASAWASLSLSEVLQSTDATLPSLEAASSNRGVAEADVLAARGRFDPTLVGQAKVYRGPEDRSELKVGLEAETWLGPTVMGGWRQGVGEYPTYDGEGKTKGEGYLGIETPLLAGLGASKSTMKLRTLEQKAVAADAKWRAVRRKARLEASKRYWAWVAACRGFDVASEQQMLAERRASALEREIELGKRAKIDGIDNDRVLAERASDRALAEAKRIGAAHSLSLFLRDGAGRPRVPEPSEVPESWGNVPELPDVQVLDLSWRPELAVNQAAQDRLLVERRGARSRVLPEAKAKAMVYAPVNPEEQAEVVGALSLRAPLAMRQGRGAVRAADAGLAVQQAQRRGLEDAIRAEILVAVEVRRLAEERANAARTASERAQEVLELERRRFELGGSTLFQLLQRESSLAKDRKALIDAEYGLRVAVATLDAALWSAKDEP